MYVSHTSHQSPVAPTVADRPNMYVPIHKAIRSMMADTLCRVGRLDTDDAASFDATLTQLRSLLTLCTKHIEHEEVFVHPAIEALLPAVSSLTESEHVEHLATIASLDVDVIALRSAGLGKRPALARDLYRHLALFIADSIQHFDVEETVNAEALWSNYTDAQLHAIHERLIASISPEMMAFILRWTVPALTPIERAALFGDLQSQMPADVFAGVLGSVQPYLDHGGWIKLSATFGVPQVAGLVDMRVAR